jgi:3-dehydroquinate synthase
MRREEQIVEVSLGRDSYKIYIGFDNLETLGKRVKAFSTSGVLISNPTVLSLYGERISEILSKAKVEFKFLSVSEGEEYKSLESASRLFDDLVECGLQRGDFIIALGGGVIGDLSGFVAATYMRGVPFIQVPTTLLAQVDSSVGGKVAVNHRKGKNLIGCFYQPKFVQIDIATLKTLPERELKAGMAEAIKCGFLIGEDFLSFLEKNLDSILKLDEMFLPKVVAQCCDFKARVVEEDEQDFGKRAILNYGHTFGHAVEAASEYQGILHGEAISIGMVGAALISEELGWVDRTFVHRHIDLFKRVGLPFKLEAVSEETILNHIVLDKKGREGSIRFVLLKAPGEPVVLEVSPQIIKKVLSQLIYS